MKVVSVNPSGKKAEERKQALLEVIEEMREQIESGRMQEFVACSIDSDNGCQIHVSSLDLPGAVGLYEIGKHMVIVALANEEDN